MPSDLCSPEVHSPLSDIFLNNNQLTGTLDVSACQNLILLNAAFNNLTGELYSPQGYNHMHTVQLQSNEFNMTDTLDGIIAGGRVTEINMADNRHNEFDYSARTGLLLYRWLLSSNMSVLAIPLFRYPNAPPPIFLP